MSELKTERKWIKAKPYEWDLYKRIGIKTDKKYKLRHAEKRWQWRRHMKGGDKPIEVSQESSNQVIK